MPIPVRSDILSMLHNPKIRRFFGVVTLCVAAIATLLALGFVGVSFATDNWKHISVNRNKLAQIVKEQNSTKLNDEFAQDYRYFDRVEGIFRVCFPMAEKPQRMNDDIYLSPVVQEWCANIDYEMILNHGFLPDKLTSNGKVWINLARATIASFVVYFALMALACWVGLAGCWGMSSSKLRATSILTAFAFIFATSGMGLFHATNFYERNMVMDERLEFFQTWSEMLQESTTFNLGWSYIIAWFGIILTLIAALLYGSSGMAIKVSMSEIALVDHEEVVNRAFESSVQPGEYFENTLRRHGSMANGMQLHSVMHPSLCPPGVTCIPPYMSMDDHEQNSFHTLKKQKIFPDAQL